MFNLIISITNWKVIKKLNTYKVLYWQCIENSYLLLTSNTFQQETAEESGASKLCETIKRKTALCIFLETPFSKNLHSSFDTALYLETFANSIRYREPERRIQRNRFLLKHSYPLAFRAALRENRRREFSSAKCSCCTVWIINHGSYVCVSTANAFIDFAAVFGVREARQHFVFPWWRTELL